MEKVSILCAHSSVNRWPISANQFLRNSAMHPMESKQIITKFMNKLLFVETVNSHHIYALVYNWQIIRNWSSKIWIKVCVCVWSILENLNCFRAPRKIRSKNKRIKTKFSRKADCLPLNFRNALHTIYDIRLLLTLTYKRVEWCTRQTNKGSTHKNEMR